MRNHIGKLNPNYRHGLSKTPIYRIWAAMMKRCTNPDAINWERYGGRGISVCERWRDFRNFLADMGECPRGCSLDRIDNSGNYEPANCRWATAVTQARNSRTAHNITFNGETMCITAWAERAGMPRDCLSRRLKTMSFEDAISLPKNGYYRRGR